MSSRNLLAEYTQRHGRMRLVVPLGRQVEVPGLDGLQTRGTGVVEDRRAVGCLVGRVGRELVQVRAGDRLAAGRAQLHLFRNQPVAEVRRRQRERIGRIFREGGRIGVLNDVSDCRCIGIRGPQGHRHVFAPSQPGSSYAPGARRRCRTNGRPGTSLPCRS